jgi:diaminopimelate epimerase
MKTIAFSKMSGSGNDFIIIANLKQDLTVSDYPQLARQLCRRKLSVGADGLILLEPSNQADFKWRFYNSDGSRAEMCGNGARCAARFAYLNKIAGKQLSFETDAGIIAAEIKGEQVKIRMTDPVELKIDQKIQLSKGVITASFIDTGVPHVVLEVDDPNLTDVAGLGREIRYHDAFSPAGTNVNFVSSSENKGFFIRTYERGVEDETLACGTGCVAAALVLAEKRELSSPVDLITFSGGLLRVYFSRNHDGFDRIYLEGDARLVNSGHLHEDAWNYQAPQHD